MSTSKIVAAVITEKARAMGTTIKAIGEKLGLSEEVTSWLKGSDEEVSADALALFAKELNTTVDEIKKDVDAVLNPKKKPAAKKTSVKNTTTPLAEVIKKKIKETPTEVKKAPAKKKAVEDPDEIPGQMSFADTMPEVVNKKTKTPVNKATKTVGTKNKTSIKTVTPERQVIDTLSESLKEQLASAEKTLKELTAAAGKVADKTLDKRYAELIRAAENSSEEGIRIATAILRKWKVK